MNARPECRWWLGGAVALVVGLVVGSASAEPVPAPTTAPPRFAVVSGVDAMRGIVVLLETRSIVVQRQNEPVVIVDVSAVQLSLKECRAWTAGGKEIPPGEVAKRLKGGQTVLLSQHGQKPDKAFLGVLKEETVILVEALKK